MTNKKILDGNKLIAEFIKLPYIGKNIYGFSGDVFDLTVGEVKGNILCYANAESMQFHSSWDWLMLVIDKIESLEGSNPFKDNPKVKFQGDHVEIFWYSTYRGDCIYWKNYLGIDGTTYPHKNQENSRILALFRAVIEFIQWYNQKSQ